MSYTLANLQNDVKRKFGDQFKVSVELTGSEREGESTWTWTVKRNAVENPLGGIRFNDFRNVKLESLRCGKIGSADVRCDKEGKLTFVYSAHTSDRLKRVGKAVIQGLERVNTTIAQQLLITRNEIADELEQKKAAYAKANAQNQGRIDNYNNACDTCLKEIDKGFQADPENPFNQKTLIATARALQSLDGTSCRVGQVMCVLGGVLLLGGLLALALFPGAIIACLVAPAAMVIYGGAGVAIVGNEIANGNMNPSIKFSKIGRMVGQYGSLFAKQQKQQEAAAEVYPLRFATQ